MARFTVTTPSPGHTGKVGNVTFVDGVAEIDDEINPSELAYCRNAGYGVTEASTAGPTDKTATGGAGEVIDTGDNPPDDDALRADLERLGVKADPRWKTKRLTTELDKARAAAGDQDAKTTGDNPPDDDEPGDGEETTS